MLDIVIRGGQVVTPEGVGQWDVGIQGERIVAIAAPGTLGGDVGRVIDATGKLVIPGGIDPHVHMNQMRVVKPEKDGGELAVVGAGPDHVGRAALHGGVTTLVDFAVWGTLPGGGFRPDMSLLEAIANQEKRWREGYCDYALHVMLRSPLPPEVVAQVPEAISEGFPSFKMFMTSGRPSRRDRKSDLGDIYAVMEQAARHNGIMMIHAEDDELVMYMHDRLEREGRIALENMPLVHSIMSEDLSFRRIIRLARYVEGAALYMAHVSAKVGVDAIAEARADGYPVYGEVLPHYATFTADIYRQPDGPLYHTYPALKYEQDRERLWSGLREGSLNTMATDEVCTSRAIKLRGNTIFDTGGGYVGVETLLPVVYTEGVSKRGLSLERFVAITSTNAAKILGLYPRKGAIAVGSDADLVVFDPSMRKTVRAADLHESDFTIWEGWESHGWPAVTLLRGEVVVDEGQFKASQGGARRAPRKMQPAVLNGPTVV